MKINQLYIVFLQFSLLLISSTYSKSELETLTDSKYLSKKTRLAMMTNTASVRNSLHKNPLRLMHLDREKTILSKFRFIWKQSVNSDTRLSLNKFNYKAVQINMDSIIIFEIDQSDSETIINESNYNAENYLMTIKLTNIDLPCNDNLYICGLGELRNEYQRKLKGVNFDIITEVTETITEDVAECKCLAITIGSFNNLSEIGYLCFETKEDFIFYSNLISERVFQTQNRLSYDGQLEYVNEVSS